MKSFWLEDRFPAKPESEAFLLTLLFYCRWLLLLRSLLFRPAPWQLYLFANISRGLSSSMAAAIKVRLLVSAVVYEELHVSRMFVVGLLLFLNAWLKCLLGCQNLRNALNESDHLIKCDILLCWRFRYYRFMCNRNSKMAAHFDVFCKIDSKFSINHKKCFSQLKVMCFITSSP